MEIDRDSLFGALQDFKNLYGEDGQSDVRTIIDIDVELISSFRDHPFKVVENEEMAELADSIRQFGILTPVTVRKNGTGGYEMISGHRRLHAAKMVGLKEIPAKVVDYDDDMAIIMVVDANIYRKQMLPSERAYSYKMREDAFRRMQKHKLSNPVVTGFLQTVPEKMEELTGMNQRTIRQYIRLAYLIPRLMDMVDDKEMNISIGVDISFYCEDVQYFIVDYIYERGMVKKEGLNILKKLYILKEPDKEEVFACLDGTYRFPDEEVQEETQEESQEEIGNEEVVSTTNATPADSTETAISDTTVQEPVFTETSVAEEKVTVEPENIPVTASEEPHFVQTTPSRRTGTFNYQQYDQALPASFTEERMQQIFNSFLKKLAASIASGERGFFFEF